jgi:hypothetical protein
MFDVTWTDDFHYQSHYVNTDNNNITQRDQRKNAKIIDMSLSTNTVKELIYYRLYLIEDTKNGILN